MIVFFQFLTRYVPEDSYVRANFHLLSRQPHETFVREKIFVFKLNMEACSYTGNYDETIINNDVN